MESPNGMIRNGVAACARGVQMARRQSSDRAVNHDGTGEQIIPGRDLMSDRRNRAAMMVVHLMIVPAMAEYRDENFTGRYYFAIGRDHAQGMSGRLSCAVVVSPSSASP
jgi:hypothetical protein